MSIFSSISEAIFKDKKQSSAVSAKERLHLVLISDRAGRDVPDYMPKMRQEIFEIDSLDEVEFNFDNKNNTSIMEMSVSLEKKPQPLSTEQN